MQDKGKSVPNGHVPDDVFIPIMTVFLFQPAVCRGFIFFDRESFRETSVYSRNIVAVVF
jgi:hypothetical protein